MFDLDNNNHIKFDTAFFMFCEGIANSVQFTYKIYSISSNRSEFTIGRLADEFLGFDLDFPCVIKIMASTRKLYESPGPVKSLKCNIPIRLVPYEEITIRLESPENIQSINAYYRKYKNYNIRDLVHMTTYADIENTSYKIDNGCFFK